MVHMSCCPEADLCVSTCIEVNECAIPCRGCLVVFCMFFQLKDHRRSATLTLSGTILYRSVATRRQADLQCRLTSDNMGSFTPFLVHGEPSPTKPLAELLNPIHIGEL